MSEPVPFYDNDNIEFSCPTCGALVGVEQQTINGRRLIVAGRFPVKSLHGECPNPACRADIHYTAKDDLPPFVAKRYARPGTV